LQNEQLTPAVLTSRKTALVTGGCGFVGRHLVNKLLQLGYSVWIIDDLSAGKHPRGWLKWDLSKTLDNTEFYASGSQSVWFTQSDIVPWLYQIPQADSFIKHLGIQAIGDVFHLASVVGGRAKIEGDPMAVAIDLAIDAAFFRWLIYNRQWVNRVLYASSSAAYPVHLQSAQSAQSLKESAISFDQNLGQPDMTYGWSKLTGEYLARVAADYYGVHIACVRPFSGYGGDQDTSYPIPAIAYRVALHEDPLIVWGTGDQGRDFVHIDDCIEAMLLALDRIADGSGINIGSGQLTSFNQVAAILAELAGYSPQIKALADRPMGVHSRYADTSEMRTRLAWTPKINLREGLKRVLDEQMRIVEMQHESCVPSPQ